MKVPAPHREKQTKTIAIFVPRFTVSSKLYCRLSATSLCQTPQVSKAINSAAVPVRPARLQRITAHYLEADQLKTFVGVSDMWTRNVAEHVRFATARSTRTCATQHFEFQKRFSAIVPGNRKFLANLLDVRWLQAHLIKSYHDAGVVRNRFGGQPARLSRTSGYQPDEHSTTGKLPVGRVRQDA